MHTVWWLYSIYQNKIITKVTVHSFIILHVHLLYLRGRIKGTASAISVIQHGLRTGTCYTAWNMITVIVLAFLTQENQASKMQSTINQLRHGKGRAVHAIMVLVV